jgi:AraC-like DNA-binding protein
VLALLPPVIEQDVLEQLGELGVRINVLAIVKLGKQLNVQRQCKHRPGALAEYSAGDAIGVDVEAIALGKHIADHGVDAADALPRHLAHACRDLEAPRNTSASLAQVAEIVGYDSEAAFSRAFKKALGVAPSYVATFEQIGHVVAKRIFNCRTIFFMV